VTLPDAGLALQPAADDFLHDFACAAIDLGDSRRLLLDAVVDRGLERPRFCFKLRKLKSVVLELDKRANACRRLA
jgi:hypothetical protein